MSVSQDFKAGDQPPGCNGYIDTQEWARAQMKAGLKQKPCGRCGRWKFPQQVALVSVTKLPDSHGRLHDVESITCNDCEAAAKHGRAMCQDES